ncbi:MAG: class I SAM-dependent methyltransferase [Actinobacteria bacterium]|nr:class I SAM-dependent methyltransferase [Actinomycetota bacterium]MBI3685929.1 class I SAM-dependent methyltransferase [Actinomycetota bacterium]
MTNAVLPETHRRHLATLRGMPAVLDAEGLRIGHEFVMFFAEAELMHGHATRLTEGIARPDVLEVGLGLAVFAEQLRPHRVGSYTAVEPHPGVARLARQRVLDTFDPPPVVLTEPWQLLTFPIGAYDVIMYDTWPPDGHADRDFATFVAHVAIPCLRPGGRFSFFHSGDTVNAARQQVLDQYFAGWAVHPYTMPAALMPPHWTKPTRDFLIPIATKGSA